MATPAVDDLQQRLRPLGELSLEALPAMFDPASGLFCQKAVLAGDRPVAQGSNPFYTAMTVVGIVRAGLPAQDLPVGAALDALHGAAAAARPELVAEIVWASVVAGDRRGEALARALAERDDVARCDSAGLGHVVNALALAAEAYPQLSAVAIGSCRRWVAELLDRFSPAADLFAPFGGPTGIRSAILQRVTSFAAQVYPLHGLAAYHRVSGEALPAALNRAAERIVDAQGPLGQWWWLYSTKSRAVLEGYPVYSVHQDGMAFMALLPLEALGVGSYQQPLALGLEWLSERNELSTDLVRRDPPIIFRNIQRRGSDADAMFGISRANLARVASRSLHPTSDHVAADPRDLEVLRECRPYHLGWLLYAYSLAGEC